jgi:MarR family transcriptional regulator, 2-MHQ and catechol-resistance regulon repressor
MSPSAVSRKPAVAAGDELDAHAESLHAALAELVRVYQFRDRDRICCHDVSVTQCYALEALVRRGPSGLNELAAELFLDKSTTSRVVATLERKRYLTRAAHAEDGRAIVLTVTPAGRRLYERITRDLVEEEKALLADFEPEVREAAPRLLRRLARAAAARSGIGGAACCVTDKPE